LVEAVFSPLFSGLRVSLHAEKGSPPLTLSKDDVVEAKVVRSLASDKALLLINGRNITAKTTVPLRQGAVLSLKVQEASPFPALRLLGIRIPDQNALSIPALYSALKDNVWKLTSEALQDHGLPKEGLSLFRDLMNEVTQRLFLEASPELLREFIEKSGLRWEAKLREGLLSKTTKGHDFPALIKGDLKGLASQLLASGKGKTLSLERLVSTIRSIQLLNHFGLEHARQIFVPIPMQFPHGAFHVGQLLIQLPKREEDGYRKGKTRKEYVRITFLLELSRLGPLRADLSIRGKEIQGMFLLSTEEAKALVEKNIPIFMRRISERGFSFHFMACQLKDPDIVQQSLLEELIDDAEHTINLVA
jgi:hypothetical protein